MLDGLEPRLERDGLEPFLVAWAGRRIRSMVGWIIIVRPIVLDERKETLWRLQ
jgi:hypothetical protein